LLSVRPRVLWAALRWLQSHNRLYADVGVHEHEMEGWTFADDIDVPTAAYERMTTEQETAEEVIRTAQIIPPTDRGQDFPDRPPTVEDVVMQLTERGRGTSGRAEVADGGRPQSLKEATGRGDGGAGV